MRRRGTTRRLVVGALSPYETQSAAGAERPRGSPATLGTISRVLWVIRIGSLPAASSSSWASSSRSRSMASSITAGSSHRRRLLRVSETGPPTLSRGSPGVLHSSSNGKPPSGTSLQTCCLSQPSRWRRGVVVASLV